MKRFFKAVRAGVGGVVEAMGPGRYAAAGVVVTCSHCGGTEFQRREAQLNTAGMSAMNLDWANRSGTALVCTSCSLIQWFGVAPDRLDD